MQSCRLNQSVLFGDTLYTDIKLGWNNIEEGWSNLQTIYYVGKLQLADPFPSSTKVLSDI